MELISPIPVSPKIHYGYRAICGKPDSPKLQRPGPPRFPVGTPRIAPQFHRGEEGLFLLARRPRGGQFLRTSNVNWGFHGNRRIGFIGRFLASPKRGEERHYADSPFAGFVEHSGTRYYKRNSGFAPQCDD